MSRIPEIVEELRALLPGDMVRYYYANALLDEIVSRVAWDEEMAKFDAALETAERILNERLTTPVPPKR